jgi:PKHD-type hydroxylase
MRARAMGDGNGRVAPVTRSERLVAISWIQSLVRDAEQRGFLFSLVETMNALAQPGGAEAEVTQLRQLRLSKLA